MSAKAFSALGKTVVRNQAATIELLDDGSAIISGTTPSVFSAAMSGLQLRGVVC
jgi:hypothetical protein